MDIPTAVTIVCIVGILGLVLVLSRGKTISNWYKHENHKTTGGSSHDSTSDDSLDMHDQHVVDFKTNLDIDCDKRKNRG